MQNMKVARFLINVNQDKCEKLNQEMTSKKQPLT